MRMIKGESLKDAIDRFHRDDKAYVNSGERTLALRDLLQRFIDVCNAVEYAHSRGIVHRDLKPSNVMLGKFRETLVVDWGLAKSMGTVEPKTVTEETVIVPELGTDSLPTRIGEIVGTAAFMSPEQASGRLDLVGAASDIYSLGATLYNLLTGEVPHPESDIGKILRHIQQGIFPRPREIKRDLPRPLEAICLKAMTLVPQDRYASSKALADDIEHYLADEPIVAYREPLIPKCLRWLRKHPKLVGSLTASVLLGLVILSLVARQQTVNARHQSLIARQQTVIADEQSKFRLAEIKKNEALRSLNARLEKTRDFMVEAFQSPDPSRDGKTVTIYEVLGRAVQRLNDDGQQDAKLRLSLLESIGDTYLGLSLYANAVPLLRQCRDLSIAEYGPRDEVTMDVTNNLAMSYKGIGQIEKALPLYEETLDIVRAAMGPRHPNTLTVMLNLAEVWRVNGELDRSLPSSEECVRLTSEELGDDNPLTLSAKNNLALCYVDDRQYPRGRALLEEVVERRTRVLGDQNIHTLIAQNNLAKCY
ncbi:MAG TPA: serine/threonine-protein kinase, partial [Pirellulaceae bacterium]